MDETGLFYSLVPDRTIAQQRSAGCKKEKTRITLALTANADGTEKLPPLFIGHAKKPRCFNRRSGDDYGFLYRSNSNAWMTAELFQEWLRNFDQRMRVAGRHILLFIDNAPSHTTEVDLPNVELCCIPPNTTSVIQPMDAGIIAAFKRRYRRYHLQNAVDRDERGERNP